MTAPAPIASPCIRVCVIDPISRFCLGCRRTLPEIAQWGAMGESGRARVMAELAQRQVRMPGVAQSPQKSG